MPVNKTSGQIILVILLILAVVLTIALSVVSRSVTDVAITTKEEEAARAFSAAEAGVERALLNGTVGVTIATDANFSTGTYSASISSLTANTEFKHPTTLTSGETATVWLVSHNASGVTCGASPNGCYTGGSIKLCWGEQGGGSTPSVEASIYYRDASGNFSVKREAYGTGLDSAGPASGCDVSGTHYNYSHTITLNPARATSTNIVGPQMIRVKSLYNSDGQTIAVEKNGSAVIPTQGTLINSTGTAGESTRKIQVNRLFPEPPMVLDYAVFSGAGGIVK